MLAGNGRVFQSVVISDVAARPGASALGVRFGCPQVHGYTACCRCGPHLGLWLLLQQSSGFVRGRFGGYHMVVAAAKRVAQV